MSGLRITLCILLFASLSACATTTPSPASINHVVFFKLKNPADADALISDCDQRLAPIPGVTSCFVGTHHDIGRGAIDSDYDVAFYVGFASEADYRAYLDHPEHIALVQHWRPRWEWIRIYDVKDLRQP